jgi:F-type H+-transporting ATPase subunit b
MNRILATIAPCWLLVGALCVPVVLAAQEKAAEPEAKTASSAKADDHAKGEAGATKSADEHAAPAQASSESPAGEHAATGAGAEAAHHDAGHHDPHDLAHGDGSSQLKAPLELRFDLAIATLIIFLLLAAILAKFAWAPIAAGLEKREQTIAKQIADAEHASAMAAKQLQEYERKLAAATEEARAIVGQARQDALTAKDRIVAEAQAAAAKERDRAVADITTAKNQALQEIAQKSVSTAISLASNIIRREVKPEDHDKLIHESLQKFSSLN